jgi:hypothetical protein
LPPAKIILSKNPIHTTKFDHMTIATIHKLMVWDSRRISVLLLMSAMLVCAGGCGRRTDKAQKSDTGNLAAAALPDVGGAARLAANTKEDTNTSAHADMAQVASNTVAYALSAAAAAQLEQALSFRSTNQFTFETISNLMANVPSQAILDRIIPLKRNREPNDPTTMAMMYMYEVVLNRGQPNWATLYARSELGDFYCYNSERCPAKGRLWAMNLLRDATLSPNPSASEQRTYVSIQFDLVRRTRGAERLGYIEKMERWVAEGKLPMPKQPVQMLPIFKAGALLNLHRDDEARVVLKELYDRRMLSNADCVRHLVDEGVEAYINGYRYGTRDPELVKQLKADEAAGKSLGY